MEMMMNSVFKENKRERKRGGQNQDTFGNEEKREKKGMVI